jgi:hypothetical protein
LASKDKLETASGAALALAIELLQETLHMPYHARFESAMSEGVRFV